MRTRDSPCRPAGDGAPRGPSGCASSDCARYEQRIDSTLRGEPAEELAGPARGRASSTDALVVAVPAWPDAGRVCVGGAPARARRRGARSRWRRRCSATRTAEVVRPGGAGRARARGRGAALRGRRRARRGPARGRARRSPRWTEPVVTASPGGWLRYHPLARARGRASCSSCSAPTRRSTTASSTRSARTARVGAPELAAQRPRAAPSLVETISDSSPDDVHRDPRLADDAAAAAAALLGDAHERGLRCRGVVASGGHLASLLVDALGAQRLSVAGEVAPLCARGTLAGGAWSGPARGDQGRPGRRR